MERNPQGRGNLPSKRRRHIVWASVCLSASALLTGCAIYPVSIQRPPPSGNPIVIAPGEHVTIRATLRDEGRYLCGSGRPLQCDSLNRKRYCFCPY